MCICSAGHCVSARLFEFIACVWTVRRRCVFFLSSFVFFLSCLVFFWSLCRSSAWKRSPNWVASTQHKLNIIITSIFLHSHWTFVRMARCVLRLYSRRRTDFNEHGAKCVHVCLACYLLFLLFFFVLLFIYSPFNIVSFRLVTSTHLHTVIA